MKFLILTFSLFLSTVLFGQSSNVVFQYNLPQPELPTITPAASYFSMKKYGTGTIVVPGVGSFDEYSAVSNGTKGLQTTGGNSGTVPFDPFATITLTAANPVLEVTIIPSTACGVSTTSFSASYKISPGGPTSFNVFTKEGAAPKTLLGNFTAVANNSWQSVSNAGTFTSAYLSPTAANVVVTFEAVGGTVGSTWGLDNISFAATQPAGCGTTATTPTPFSGCPNTNLAIVRSGGNTYANEAVTISNVDITTGTTTALPGGPIKNPAGTANMDVNAVGLNKMDGFLYAMNPDPNTQTPNFYRIGSNYATVQVGVIGAPVAVAPAVGVVNSVAGEFDNLGNYYFTAVTGVYTATPTFTPQDYYIGKIANVSALVAGSTATITPSYTKLNFSATNCTEYLSTLNAAITPTAAQNTGLSDLIYNQNDGLIYTYVTFEFPASSGTFKGQLLSVNPSTGIVTCYTSTPAIATGVSGILMTAAGDIVILFSNGALYKAVTTTPGVYTGAITLLNASALANPLRGDLAGCGTAVLLPVTFESFTVTENDCKIKYKWTVSQEINVRNYDLEIMNINGTFISVAKINATNSTATHSYSTLLPATNKLIIARVKQTDLNGSFKYSEIKKIATSCLQKNGITILNSAAVTNNVEIAFNNFSANSKAIIAVYNNYGALVAQKNMVLVNGISVLEINTASFATGIYMVSVITDSGDKYSSRFIKN